ncbi:CAP domain-containing protein [Hydrogenimonas sp. SS33]|uniref:CAP domain-containing protein n=1 Tax=Hydrogenimonas leucolamina TaxID=2954236 RepID=UPI00336C302D
MKFVRSLFLLAAALLLQASELDYLNTIRKDAGLAPFKSEAHLQQAAQNHSAYMKINQTSGHHETSGKEGYTGKAPWDRAVYAGYPSTYIAENVSSGQKSPTSSIDSLMGAIYHRFGFLSFHFDEIGIGFEERYYTYDMGNSAVAALCAGNEEVTGDYYTGVCADPDKRVDADRFMEALERPGRSAPRTILWPAPDTAGIPPAFFEESPDPLPDASVTGYPVSVEFNEVLFSEPPEILHFSLEKGDGAEVTPYLLMKEDNDPNHKFSGYQFALFPRHRLEWGTAYFADLLYRYDGSDIGKRWCFTTRSLADDAQKVYRIEHDRSVSLNVVSGVSYAVYVVPEDLNDTLGGVGYSYNCEKPDFRYIDENTFLVTLNGSAGRHADFTFANGQKVEMVIAREDSARPPAKGKCPDIANGGGTSPGEGNGSTQNGTGTGEGTEDASPQESGDANRTAPPEGTNGSRISRQSAPGQPYEPLDEAEGFSAAQRDGAVLNVGIDTDKRLHCRYSDSGTTTEILLADGTARIGYDDRVEINLPDRPDLEILLLPDGSATVTKPGALLPAGKLPPGCRIEVENGHMRIRLPLNETITLERKR